MANTEKMGTCSIKMNDVGNDRVHWECLNHGGSGTCAEWLADKKIDDHWYKYNDNEL